ncbi:MAG TPA: hypothetical protein VM618_03580 [Acidimicrobiia bacterium]|nr:hypothetical protein [Acidimicrobiia bacterium]
MAGLSFSAQGPLDLANPFGTGGDMWFREGLSSDLPDASSVAAPTCPLVSPSTV